MPQIAQQDYNFIRSAVATLPYNDAETLAKVSGAIKRGTIFDTILSYVDPDESEHKTRVICVTDDSLVIFYDGFNGELYTMPINYSESQYEGLAAIQKAAPEDYRNFYPSFALTGSPKVYLYDNFAGYLICVDNKAVIVEQNGGLIVSLTVSDLTVGHGEGVNIAFEDLQKLIGLPISI